MYLQINDDLTFNSNTINNRSISRFQELQAWSPQSLTLFNFVIRQSSDLIGVLNLTVKYQQVSSGLWFIYGVSPITLNWDAQCSAQCYKGCWLESIQDFELQVGHSPFKLKYGIVMSTSPSCFEAHTGLRFQIAFMKGIFDPYVLWPFGKKLMSFYK